MKKSYKKAFEALKMALLLGCMAVVSPASAEDVTVTANVLGGGIQDATVDESGTVGDVKTTLGMPGSYLYTADGLQSDTTAVDSILSKTVVISTKELEQMTTSLSDTDVTDKLFSQFNSTATSIGEGKSVTIDNSAYIDSNTGFDSVVLGSGTLAIKDSAFANNLTEGYYEEPSTYEWYDSNSGQWVEEETILGYYAKGGAINTDGGNITSIENSTFSNNSAEYYGGAINTSHSEYVYVVKDHVEDEGWGWKGYEEQETKIGRIDSITDSTFSYNSASFGGAIWGNVGTINDSAFLNNWAWKVVLSLAMLAL